MIHQIALEREYRELHRESTERASRHLYTAIAHVQQHLLPAEYVVLYFDHHHATNTLIYRQFAEWYGDCRKVHYATYALLRHNLTHVPDAVNESVEVRPATQDDWRWLSRWLRIHTTPIEYDALSYGAGEIALAEFSRASAAQGHERGRDALIAVRDGVRVAVLLAETGAEGLNVFGLLNMCWLLVPEPRHSEAAVASRALLSSALCAYRDAGKHSLLLNLPCEQDSDVALELGFGHVATGARLIAHRDTACSWQSYLDTRLGAPRSPVERSS